MTEQERISQIEHSLAGLEQQIYDLRFELKELKENRQIAGQTEPMSSAISDIADTALIPASPAVKTTAPVQAGTPAADSEQTTAPVSKPIRTTAPVSAPVPTVAPVSKPAPAASAPKAKSASKFEENLGGKVMGIVAAVLVFVGLFLFGSMLYEQLGDTARVAILFIVSFFILGLGLFLERKRRSRFTTSLVGCGFGAIYISLFITALYYEMFGVEVLYVLLFLWLLGTGLYVFLRQSFTVALLGQIGISFSVIFGCLGVESKGQYTFLCIYFAALSLLYLWVVLWRFLPDTKNKPYSWIQLTAFGLNLLQLVVLAANYDSLFGEWGTFGGKNPLAGILLCLYCLGLPLFFLLRQRTMAGLPLLPSMSAKHPINEHTFPVYKAGIGSVWLYTIHQILAWTVFSLISGSLFEADVPRGLFLFSGLLISYLITELFGPTGTEGRGASVVNATAPLFLVWEFDFPPFLGILVLMLFCIVTALFGMFGNEYPVRSVLNTNTHRWEYLCKEEKGRCFDKFTSCVYLLPILGSYEYGDAPFILFLITVFGVAFFAGSFIFLYRNGKDHRYADGFKNTLYAFGILYLFVNASFLIENVIEEDILHMALSLTVLVLCNCAAFYSGFRKMLSDTARTDTVAAVFVRVIHTGLWIWGIALLHSNEMEDYPLLCVWLLLLTLYLCGSGLYEQYKQYHNKPGLGIYFGLRVTLYLLAVMAAFDGIEGYVISCVLLVLAILAVLAGFPLRLAPLRIYGLCLAMFAVIKLLMIDVEHDNSMETVLCFLGAGILCFAINFIYNHVKKRFKSDAN